MVLPTDGKRKQSRPRRRLMSIEQSGDQLRFSGGAAPPMLLSVVCLTDGR
jgi:hypothetical protein